MTGPRDHRRPGWLDPDLVWIGALILLAVAVPLIVGAAAGTLEIPRNDDWSYRHIALGLAQTGRFALDGISETMIIGQVLFIQPLLWLSGLQPWAFTAAGVIFATGGIVGAFWLARRLLPAREAAFAAALLALVPGYLAYATSFMSDVPALAAQFICLALGAIAIQRRPASTTWLVAAGVMGVVAFSVREFAIAAPASVCLAAIAMEPRRLRSWLIAAIVAAACVLLHVWHAHLPGQLPPVGAGYGAFSASTQAFSSVAFAVAPAALLGASRWRHQLHRFDLFAGLLVGGILVMARATQWIRDGSIPPMILDNLASQWGVPSKTYLVGGRPLLFTDDVWAAVYLVALAASVIVLTVGAGIIGAHLRRLGRSRSTLVSRLGSPAGILFLFVASVAAGLVVFGLTRPVFDRYLWPMVPTLAALFLYVPADLPASRVGAASTKRDGGLLVSAMLISLVLLTVSAAFLLNANAFEAARWAAGQRLVAMGLPPDQVDAGYEWVGYYATTPGDPTLRTSTDTFYRSWWPAFRQCGIVSSDAVPPVQGELVGTVDYQLDLVAGPVETLHLYRVHDPECAQH